MRHALHTACIAAIASSAAAQQSYPYYGYHLLDAKGAAAIVDLDGDGFPELIAEASPYKTRVFHNAGAGAFGSFTDYDSPPSAGSPTAVDVTGDGVLDLIVLGNNAALVRVRPGLGAGLFGGPIDTPAPQNTFGMVLRDLTADGRPDVVAVNGAQIILLPGDGSGAFGAPQPLATATANIKRLAVADIDGDGLDDLVALATDSLECVILLAAPGGGLQEPTHLAVPPDAESLALADADTDGDTDIVIGQINESGGHSRGVWLYTNDGHAAFSQPGVFTSTAVPDASAQPLGIGVAELSGDGLPDLVVCGDELIIFYGTGDPHTPFGDPFVWGQTFDLFYISFADLNADGATDMVASGWDCKAFLNEGAGRFLSEWSELAIVRPWKLEAADLNDDGTTDLAILAAAGSTQDYPSSLSLLLTDGAGGYTHTEPVDLPTSADLLAIQPIDQNAPGHLDLAVADRNSFLWLPNLGGQGQQWMGIGEPTVVTHGYNQIPRALVSTDFEFLGTEQNTPDPDLLLVSSYGGEVYFHTHRNDGAGNYTAEPVNQLPNSAHGAAWGDTDADGDTDIVYATNSPNSGLQTRFNQAAGSPVKQRLDNVWVDDTADIRMTDINGDGAIDAVMFTAGNDGSSGGASLLLNNGTGDFSPARSLFGRDGVAFDLGRINDDPWPDAVVLSTSGSQQFIELATYLGNEQGQFTGPYVTTLRASPGGWQGRDIAIVDLDADGQGEVAAAVSHADYPSLGAVLLLEPRAPDPCPADFNHDGAVNTIDVIAFLGAWSAGDPGADVNHDGLVNTQDVIAFLGAWAAGC